MHNTDPWQILASCVGYDPELWFPTSRNRYQTRAARLICADCPVKQQCLTDALDNEQTFGIWGGHTADERKLIRRRNITRRRGPDPDMIKHPCGTAAAYARHRRNNETPCILCKDAHSRYKRDLRQRRYGE